MAKSKVVKELSKESLDLIPVITDKWIKIGLQTGKANREETEKAVVLAYQNAKLKPPKEFIWVASPKEVIQFFPNKKKEYFDNVIYGQHNADTFAYYDFFLNCKEFDEKTKNEIREKIVPLMTIAQNVNWWWALEDKAVLSERAVEIHFDAGNRLHRENDMAIKYADGWGFYSWHGYTIPDDKTWIITNKEKLNPDVIEKESNAELRRIMLEVFGFDKYLAKRKAKVVSEDVDVNGNPRRLLEMKVGNENIRVLEVTNGTVEPDGTLRKFHLGAMPGDTPHAAVAASYGFNPDVYKESVRT